MLRGEKKTVKISSINIHSWMEVKSRCFWFRDRLRWKAAEPSCWRREFQFDTMKHTQGFHAGLGCVEIMQARSQSTASVTNGSVSGTLHSHSAQQKKSLQRLQSQLSTSVYSTFSSSQANVGVRVKAVNQPASTRIPLTRPEGCLC